MSEKPKTPEAEAAFPPPYTSEPRGYALSGKIMLSAIVILFAVVIIMVMLHIYARWYILRARRRQIRRARRRTHLVFYIDPNTHPSSAVAAAPSRGLDPLLLFALPTFTFTKLGTSDKNEDGDDVADNEDEVLDCAVCLSEFEDGEKGRLLPKCKHSFHVDCIDMWFHSHSTCPICRAPVEMADLKDDQKLNSAAAAEEDSGRADGPGPGDVAVEVELGTNTTSSGGGRVKVAMVEVSPRRCQSFCDESGPSHGFSLSKSPTASRILSPSTNRILSLKRILSRERRSPLPSPSGVGPSSDLDLEMGRVDPAGQPSSIPTPR